MKNKKKYKNNSINNYKIKI